MNPDEKRVMRLTTTSHGLVHLFEGVLPPLIPLMVVQFQTDYFTLGLIVTVFSYAFGLGSLPAGFLSDRIGPRILITTFLLGAGALSIAVWPVNSLWSYGAIMGAIGLLCSVYHPASNALISHTIRERGRAYGIHGIAGSLGVALVPLLSAWMGALLGWRFPHIVFGALGIMAGLYALTLPPAPPVQSASAPATTSKSATKAATNSPSEGIPWLTISIFLLSAAALGMTYKGIMTFLPAYMGEKVLFDGLDAVKIGGTFATLALLWGAVGQYVAGRLVDRFPAELVYTWAIVAGTLFVFLMATRSGWGLVLAAIFYAFFYFATQPIQNYLLASYLPPRHHGRGFGVHFCITFGIGSTAAAVCGWLADAYGLTVVFWTMGGCFSFSALMSLILLVRVRYRRRISDHAQH